MVYRNRHRYYYYYLHTVRSGSEVAVSNVINTFVGGHLPVITNGGMGSGSAISGTNVCKVTMPLPII